MKRLFYASIGAYVLLFVTILSPYITSPDASSATMVFFNLQWYIPLLLLILLLSTRASKLLDKVTNVKVWTLACYVALVVCVILTLMRVPGLWWTWATIGLLFAVLVLIMNLTKDRMRSSESFLLGCGCVLIGAALWETVYQSGLLYYYDFFGDGVHNYLTVVTWMIIWTYTGLTILFVTLLRHKGLVHINGAFITCVALFGVLTTLWFTNGMWVPLWWWKGTGPFASEPNTLMMSVLRGSKAFFILSPAMLLIPRRNRCSTKT